MKQAVSGKVVVSIVGIVVLLAGLLLWRTFQGEPTYDANASKGKSLPPLITANPLKPPKGMSGGAAMAWTAEQRAKEAESRSTTKKE